MPTTFINEEDDYIFNNIKIMQFEVKFLDISEVWSEMKTDNFKHDFEEKYLILTAPHAITSR